MSSHDTDRRENQGERLAALATIYDAPVIWRTGKPGNQTIMLEDTLKREVRNLSDAHSIPDHLKEGAEARKEVLNRAIEGLRGSTPHPHADAHRQAIVEGLRNLPESAWTHEGPVVLCAPAALLNLLNNLTVPVTKKDGLEVRLWDGCGDDTICLARDQGNGRITLHLAGPGIHRDHILLYQMLREGHWRADACKEICALL